MRASECLAPWFLAALAAAPAFAAEDTTEAIRACRAEADDSRRLACYDRAAGEAPAGTPVAAAAVPAAAPAAAAALPEDNFGRERQMEYEKEQRQEKEDRAIGKLEASVVSIETRMDGLMTIALDNGQVWRQNAPDSRFRLASGDAVSIQPGSLGSYILAGPTKKSTRVTRVK